MKCEKCDSRFAQPGKLFGDVSADLCSRCMREWAAIARPLLRRYVEAETMTKYHCHDGRGERMLASVRQEQEMVDQGRALALRWLGPDFEDAWAAAAQWDAIPDRDKKMRKQFELPSFDTKHLETLGLEWETIVGNGGKKRWLFLHDWPVPDGYNVSRALVALLLAPGYPDSQIDSAYFHPPLERKDGKYIGGLASHNLDGKTFQRWYRHRTKEAPWRPGEDDVSSHLVLVTDCLEREFEKRCQTREPRQRMSMREAVLLARAKGVELRPVGHGDGEWMHLNSDDVLSCEHYALMLTAAEIIGEWEVKEDA